MKLGHFEAVAPVCPTCRALGREPAPLAIHQRLAGGGDDIDEGALVCTERMCQAEFPIIDGVPYITANLAQVISGQLDAIERRRDLSEYTRSLLGDAAGPESPRERERYQVSSYARSHYGDLDPDQPLDPDRCLTAVVGPAIELAGAAGDGGLWLDCGCGPGRSSFELAAATGGPVLGIDLNVGMLRVAAGAARGRVSHPLRRVGLVYGRRDFAADFAAAARVDFWACDVLALPFSDGRFAGALSVNVLDCVGSPLGHLRELGRVLDAGAAAVIGSPFDWSTAATPLEGWIGGHTGRAAHRGSSATELARLLAEGDPAGAGTHLVIDGDPREVDWEVYVHERASMRYRVHLRRATRV